VFNTQRSSPVELRKVWPISQCWRRVSPHFRLVTPWTVVSSNLSLPTDLLCWTSTTRFRGVSLASSPYWHEILSGGIRNRFGAACQAVIQRANVHLHNVANYTVSDSGYSSPCSEICNSAFPALYLYILYLPHTGRGRTREYGDCALRYDVHTGSGAHSTPKPMCHWK
jgi:hypothetical protein